MKLPGRRLLVFFLAALTVGLWYSRKPVAAFHDCGLTTPNCDAYNASCQPPTPGFGVPTECQSHGGRCREGQAICDPINTPSPTRVNTATPTAPPNTNTATPTAATPTNTATVTSTVTITPPTGGATPPSGTPSPTRRPTGTPGAPCIVGQSSSCATGLSCVCQGSNNFSCNVGAPGECKPHMEVCGPNPAMGCVADADCVRTCGTASSQCRGGRCWDDSPVTTGGTAPCTGGGMSCMPYDQCNDGVNQCGTTNSLRCTTAGHVCCAPRACPTPGGGGSGERFAYQECGSADNPGINTAIGCIKTNPADFIRQILTIGIGMGGGIAFLMILLGGFKIITSRGNPEAISEGRDTMTSAIAGLMLIIFAVFILRFIGVNILALPGFG